jgi:hypothetical protein
MRYLLFYHYDDFDIKCNIMVLLNNDDIIVQPQLLRPIRGGSPSR